MFHFSEPVNTKGSAVDLLPPGIYNGTVEKIAIVELEATDKLPVRHILQFSLKTDAGRHNHSVYFYKGEPTDREKMSSYSVQLLLIPNAMFGSIQSAADPLRGSDNMELFKEVIARCEDKAKIKSGGSYEDFPISFKITGSVWEGKPKAAIPGYGGSVVKLGEPINFSASEKAKNAQYAEKLAEKSKAKESTNTPKGGDDDLPF